MFLSLLIVVIAVAQLENLVDIIINDFDNYADRWDGMVTLAMLLLELLYCTEGYNKQEGADIQNMTSTCTQINEK
ncbi:MAG: hypothetical protein ACJ705_08485 [Nitrososphaeraceae archaeon]